jgi:hypothetical protein
MSFFRVAPFRIANSCCKCLILIAAAFALAAGIAVGQGVTGQILGTVQDQTKSVIPGATIVVTNQDTGYQATVPTGATGEYVIPDLPPGQYTVTASAKGFENATSKNVLVIVNGTSRVDFTMQIGASTQTVEVQATAPLVDSTNATMGNDLSTRQIENIPLYGRVYSQLVDLMPGAVKTGIGSSAESGTGIGANGSITASINGMPYQGTTFTLDGVSDMELENAFQNITPPVDSLEEVKVSGNNAGADVGVYGGAQVNAVVKSGTNQIHGTAYEYYRTAGFNANSWYAGFNGAKKAPFRSNQYGASIGGPIKRDKLFYFGDFQGLQYDNGITYTYTVPTVLEQQGYFPQNYFPNGIYDPQSPGTLFPSLTLAAGTGSCAPSSTSKTVPSCTVQCIPGTANSFCGGAYTNRWDPVAAAALANNTIWPAAQTQAEQNNFIENVTSTNPQYQFDVKIDYNLKSQDHIFGRASYQRNNLLTPGPTKFLNVGEDARPREHNDVFGYTHAFSPNVVNEFRFGFDRFYTFHFGNDYGINEDTTLGIPNGNLPQFPFTSGIASLSFGSDQNSGGWPSTGHPGSTDAIRKTNTYELVDNITQIHGKHTLGYGVDYRRLQATVTNPDHSQSGTFSFDNSYTSNCAGIANGCSVNGGTGAGFADFMLGLPTSISRDIVNAFPQTRLTIADLYVQDQFRITRQLTLIYGLRWDLITQYNDVNNHQSNFNINTGYLDVATPENRGPDVYTPYHNFGPRLGIAYSPDGGRTAFRAGFSITHFPDHYGAAGGTLERNWPWFEEYTLGQQSPNTPWAEISTNLNMPAGACPLGASTQIPTCFIGLPRFVPQQVTNTVTPSPSSSLYYVPYNNQPDQESMWNVGIQRELTSTSSIDIAYVGTKGNNLFRSINIDQDFPGPEQIYMNLPCSGSSLTTPTVPTTLYSSLTCVNGTEIANSLQANRVYSTLGCSKFDPTATLAAYNPATGIESDGSQSVCDQGPVALIGAINERGSTGYSNYNALQIKYTKRISHGLEALLSYTWSKEIDDMTVFVPLVNQDQYNRALGDSSAPDVPQNFIGSFVYDLPFGKGRDFMNNVARPVDLLLGGWNLSGVTTIQHGVPLVVSDGLGNNGGLNGGFGNRANFSSSCGKHAGIVNEVNTQSSTLGQQWFTLSCFSNPAETAVGPTGIKVAPYGTSVPGNVWGPGLVNFDLSLTKGVNLTENKVLQFQVNAFNAMNTPHLSNPNTSCCTSNNAGFGVITGTSNPNRQLQLGLHFQF